MCCGVVETTLTLQHKHRRSSWLMWAQAWSWRLSVHHFGFWLLADFGMAHEGLVSLPSFPSFPFFQCSRVPGKSPQFSCLDGCEVKSGWLTSLALWSLVAAPALQQVVQRYPTFATCHLWFLLALFIGGLFQSFRVQHWIIEDEEFFVFTRHFGLVKGCTFWEFLSRIRQVNIHGVQDLQTCSKTRENPTPFVCFFFLLNSPYVKSKGSTKFTGWR